MTRLQSLVASWFSRKGQHFGTLVGQVILRRLQFLLFSGLFSQALFVQAQSSVDGTYGGPANGGVYQKTGNGPIELVGETTLVVAGGGLRASDPFAGDQLVIIGALVDAGNGLFTVRATELVSPLDFLGIPSATVFFIRDGAIRATNRAGNTIIWLEAPVAGAKPPEITQQPTDVTLSTESTAFLNVFAKGADPLSFQWYRNGTLIPGAQVSQYQVIPLPAYVGSYFCVVSNSIGSLTSSVVRVRVDAPGPKATLPPTFNLAVGLPQSFGVTVSGGQEPYTYAWEKNGVLVPGVTGFSFSFPAVSAGDAGSYRCLVTDGFGNQAVAGPTVVTVQLPPAPRFLTKQRPLIQAVGSSLILRLHFESQQSTPPSAAWRRRGQPIEGTSVFFDNGTGDWVAVLQIATTGATDSGDYDCVATGLGGTTISESTRVLIKRLDAPDTVDLSFNAGAANSVAFNNPDGPGAIEAIAVQADDKILVAGTFKKWNGQARTNLVRLNVDGSLDTSFAAHHFLQGIQGEIAVPAIAVAPDGRIYVAGIWQTFDGVDDGASFHLIRLKSDGTQDPTFTLPALTAAADELVILSDGTIFNNGLRLVNNLPQYLLKFPAGGALDGSFSAGYTTARFSGNTADAMVAHPDGGLYLGGTFGVTVDGFPRFKLARLNANGSVNGTFRSALLNNDLVNHLVRQSDGKLVAVGDFAGSGGNVRRFREDGSFDPAFQSPVKDAAFSPLALTADQAILVAPNTGNNLARLNSDGSVDEAFAVAANDDIKLIAVDSKGRIVIAGYFSEVRGSFDDVQHAVARRSIARLTGGLNTASGPNSGTPAPVSLGGFTLSPGGKLGFTLPTQLGFTYRLEQATRLDAADWMTVQSVTGDGGIKALDATAVGQVGYFRVRILP